VIAARPSAPLDVFLCGGSQLAATGLPPTAALPARLARLLRTAWGAGEARVHPVYCDVDPGALAPELGLRLSGQPFAVVLIPRNKPIVLEGMADALRHLVAVDLSLPPEVPAGPPERRWLRARHWWLSHLWYAAWVLALPVRLARYVTGLERTIRACRRQGCRLFVVATPVPYPGDRSRRARAYQRLLAALIRRRVGRGVAVADLFGHLTAAGADPILPHDPHHLTVEGHRQAADELMRALAAVR
jgi:hypothetical protein